MYSYQLLYDFRGVWYFQRQGQLLQPGQGVAEIGSADSSDNLGGLRFVTTAGDDPVEAVHPFPGRGVLFFQ